MNRMYWWLWIRGGGWQAVSKLAWQCVLAGERSIDIPLTKDRPSSVFVFHGVHSFGSGARGALRMEAGAVTCVHTASRYSVFGGLVRPSGRPHPGRPKALAEHWQGRTWLSRGSKSCNTVSVGELGEDPPTGLWACKFAPVGPWTCRRDGVPTFRCGLCRGEESQKVRAGLTGWGGSYGTAGLCFMQLYCLYLTVENIF